MVSPKGERKPLSWMKLDENLDHEHEEKPLFPPKKCMYKTKDIQKLTVYRCKCEKCVNCFSAFIKCPSFYLLCISELLKAGQHGSLGLAGSVCLTEVHLVPASRGPQVEDSSCVG